MKTWIKRIVLLGIVGVAFLFLLFIYARSTLPTLLKLSDYQPPLVTQLIAEGDGEVIGTFFKEKRYLVKFEEIPKRLTQSFVASEDDRFFEHGGISVVSILRAAWANFKAGGVVQGGSTITQQVAKSILLTPEKSLVRKMREVILSIDMEEHFTKEEILYLYLNQIYLGRGAYGVKAAAEVYFNKKLSELSIAECALIAGFPQAPSVYNPLIHPEKAKKRQLYVLERLRVNQWITEEEYAAAKAEPLKIYYREGTRDSSAYHFVEHIRRRLVDTYGEKAVYESGMKIYVPTKKSILDAAKDAVVEGTRSIDKRIGYRKNTKLISSDEEKRDFLSKQYQTMLRDEVGYTALMSDGTLNELFEVKKGKELTENLIKPNQIYDAIIDNVDEKNEKLLIRVGHAWGEIHKEGLSWAIETSRSKISDLFVKDEQIQARFVGKNKDTLLFSLEQEPQVEAALTSIEVRTGKVLALVGGRSFDQSQFNRAIQAQRQPGSAFKPFIYALGLQKGFTQSTVISDSPLVFEDGDFGKWRPSNYSEKFYGDTTLRHALVHSRNVPTIRLLQSLGISPFLSFVQNLNILGEFPRDMSLSLGSGTVSLMELVKAYSLFPRLGKKVEPYYYTKVMDSQGVVLEQAEEQPMASFTTLPETEEALTVEPDQDQELISGKYKITLPTYPTEADPKQVLDPRISYLMIDLLKGVVQDGTARSIKNFPQSVGGKTGTTNEYVDAWFMGFSPHVVTGVWVGFDQLRPIREGETGSSAALPIWTQYMREAVKHYPNIDFPVPPGIVFAKIPSVKGDQEVIPEVRAAFIEGTQPESRPLLRKLPSQNSSPSFGDFLKDDLN